VGKNLIDQPSVLIAFTSNPLDTPERSTGIFQQISFLPAPGGNPNVRQMRLAFSNIVPGITVGAFDLLQPQSRGSISINSSDPTAEPIIDFGFLSNPSDLALYQAGFSTYIKALNEELQQIDPLYQLVSPDPAILDDPNALANFIKEGIRSNQSFQGHCKMAPSLNQGGVVDSQGRVHGVQNLYVADDSVVPSMDGATMASAFLVAANIVRMILLNP
jgi:choline dehydrogenase